MLKSPAHDFLTDLTKLQDYDIVFIDCSSSVQAMLEGSATIPGNLKAFVESGKALYASDWAWAYIEKTWPGAITSRCSMARAARSAAWMRSIQEAGSTVGRPIAA